MSRSASSVGEHQSVTYVSPTLPKRAETFGGFDNSLSSPKSNYKHNAIRSYIISSLLGLEYKLYVFSQLIIFIYLLYTFIFRCTKKITKSCGR